MKREIIRKENENEEIIRKENIRDKDSDSN